MNDYIYYNLLFGYYYWLLLLIITMKVKPSQEDIDKLYKKLKFKLFTLKIYDNSKYYVDNETNLIWDENKDIVGIYNNKCQLFDEDTKMINTIL
jgi:hypothetical protein